MLRVSAPTKINLTLTVLARRDDGYHELESLVGFADIGDRLFISKAEETGLEITGPFSASLTADKDNLVLKALAQLEAACGQSLPSRIVLEKNLPVAAGLGGGSADAAAALRGLCRAHDISLPIADIAAALGADVPVCLDSAPAMMRGIGHDVTRLGALPAFDIVLVNPRRSLSTADVFNALSPQDYGRLETALEKSGDFRTAGELIDYLKQHGNDLQATACQLVPDIGDCLAALNQSGFAYSAMSGSGASCFGLCAPGSARAMTARYRTLREKDWLVSGRLIGAGDTEIDQAD